MQSFLNQSQAGMRWLPAICIAAAIFLFSATPGDEVGQSYHSLETVVQSAVSPSTTPAPTVHLPIIDWLKVGHGIGYFWLGAAVLYALSSHSRRLSLKAIGVCSLYAVTDEIHQSFVPARSAAAKDVLIDTFAALAGVIVMTGVIKLHALYESKKQQDKST